MDEREYRRRIEAQRRVISQSELDKRNKLKQRSENQNNKSENQSVRTSETKSKYQNNNQYGSFAVAVFGLAFASIFLAFFLLFYVQEVGVSGNEYSETGEIIQWLEEDQTRVNSVAMFVKYNYTSAELPAQVEDVKITFVNPWTLWVDIVDKSPVGGIATGSQYVYCDIEGIVLNVSDEPVEDLPLIEGVVLETYTLYEVVQIEDIDIFKNALEVTSILNIENIEFDEISCSNGAGVNITIGNILIQLGEGDYQQKIVQITPILEEVAGEEGTLNLETYSSTNQTISFERKNAEN